MQFKIEVKNGEEVFSSPAPAAFPEKNPQAEFYTLDGDLNETLKKAIVMVAMVTHAAANDTKLPEIFAAENETITLPNPFFKI